MTVPFGAIERVGVLNTLFPPPKTQPDITRVKGRKLTPLEQAQKELLANGITKEQRLGYFPRISEALNFHVDPFGYAGHGNEIVKAIVHALSPLPISDRVPDSGKVINDSSLRGQHRRDGWRLYLGLPQINNSFGISSFQPSSRKEDKIYFKINDFWKENIWGDIGTDRDPSPIIKAQVKRLKEHGGKIVGEDETATSGKMTLALGKDSRGNYMSYYDKWDLTPNDSARGFDTTKNRVINAGANMIGKPYEIYDRLYYDPKTFKIIPETKLKSAITLEEILNAEKTARGSKEAPVRKEGK